VRTSLLVSASVLALVDIAGRWWARWRRADAVEHAAFAAIIGGALGNVVDRAARG
jgi:lipoprotein signal peptidase